jgi:hypothetical protein
LVVCAAALFSSVASASAAGVANGDFETGNLSGWQAYNSNTSGNWFAYSGTSVSGFPEFPLAVPAPPQGLFAAITAQGGPGTHILYQDVAVGVGYPQVLSLTAYYKAEATLFSPETLDAEGEPNEQYRIDLMRPSAAITSVAPGDVLANLFKTQASGPSAMAPKVLTADLAAYAGQTVRLRFAEADNEGVLNAGVDAVSVTPPPPAPPSNVITLGKVTKKPKNGTAKIAVTLPGAGVLVVKDVAKKARVKAKTVTVTAAGTLNVALKPTAKGKEKLKASGKLAVKLSFSFTPTGGVTADVTRKVTLKKTLSKP